ncbi:MAG: NAD synthetase [Promethearchaeota archaeon CR_4]|nr:MAG: NAD synthetase [Candidatus Lokiarchaeota archaeon CR_4]
MSRVAEFLKDPVKVFELDWADVTKRIVTFIKAHVPGNAVLGMSGGVDSSLVATLAVKALGKEKLHCILMPTKSNTMLDKQYALNVINQLGLSHETINIQTILESFEAQDPYARDFALNNLKPRIRMSLLYTYANTKNARVLGTSNRSEWMVGYFTKYGDGGADLEPITGLYKQQVFRLARFLSVPQEIVDRPPSAGLWAGQTTEGELGISYLKLDQILYGTELGCSEDDLMKTCGVTEQEIELVQKKVANSAHKRILPPCFTLGS